LLLLKSIVQDVANHSISYNVVSATYGTPYCFLPTGNILYQCGCWNSCRNFCTI